MRRLLCIVCSMAFLLTGCSNSRQIESAAIIENVTVDRQDGGLVYTFYRLTSGDTPWGIAVSAKSFEEACRRASLSDFIRKHIPAEILSIYCGK